MAEEVAAANVDWALAYAAEGFAVVPVWYAREASTEEAAKIDAALSSDDEGASLKGKWVERAEAKWVCACDKGLDCDRPAKHPIPRQGIKQATTDAVRIRAWWKEHPEANVAMATGSVSGVILIDVDTGDGKEGDVAITTACAEQGGVPRTLKARSGSGGLHYFYRFRDNPFTRKIGFLKHVDYLSDGGYVIVAPSLNMKGGYRFDDEHGVSGPEGVSRLRGAMADLPEWFDKLEGTGKTGRKGSGKKDRNDRALRARVVNAAAMEFNREDPRWVNEVRRALGHVDPDSRDHWVLFGIILGREFLRNDDGWSIYSEWAARSAKFVDKGTERAMRTYYYEESLHEPQGGGEPATIATILSAAQEGGWVYPFGGLDSRPVVAYRAGRAMESIIGPSGILNLLAREREAENDPMRIYAFGSGLGSIVESHDFGAMYTAEGRPPNGWVLKMSTFTPMNLGSRITHTCTIVKFSPTGSTSQVECPPEVSNLVLSKYTKHFPRLNGIAQWPIVVGGKVVGTEEKYEPKLGLVFQLPDDLELDDLKGTRKDAEKARDWLLNVALAEFPFGSDKDRAAALAMALTFLQRRAMGAAPAFLINAPVYGTGKTALVRLLSRAVHGRGVAAGALSMVVEEQRKNITASLATNPPCIFFDNLKEGSSFNSAELAIAMTSGDWEDRKLGATEKMTLPNRAVWCFTGNNITLVKDLRRRFVVVRMVPQERKHYERKFTRNIETWPVEHRSEVLRALVTISLWAAREAVSLETESGFAEWDRLVRGPVVALTGVDPFRKSHVYGDEDDDEDPTEEAIGNLMLAWATFIGDEKRTVREFVERSDAALKGSDSTKRRCAEAMNSAIAVLREKEEGRLAPMDYGYAVKMLQDRPVVIGGKDVRFEHCGQRNKTALWKLKGAEALKDELDAGF